jgi:hypothetical protein
MGTMGQAAQRKINRDLAQLVGKRYEKLVLSEIESAMKHEEAKNKVWVLVEGYLDVYMYYKVFNADKILMRKVEKGTVVTGSVKKALIKTLENRSNAGMRNVIGIIDKDYEWLCNHDVAMPNLFETDGRDLEITLLMDPAVRQEIKANLPNIEDLCSITAPASRYIGYMYIAAEKMNRKLGISKWGVSNFAQTGALLADYEEHILAKLNNKLKRWGEPTLSRNDIDTMVSNMQLDAVDDKYIWRGHSTLPLLAYVNGQDNDYTDETISILLADCCTRENALNWNCFQRIKQWQDDKDYDILSKEESFEEILASI